MEGVPYMEKSHDVVSTIEGSGGSLGVNCVGDSDGGYDGSGLKTGSGLVNEIRGSNAV